MAMTIVNLIIIKRNTTDTNKIMIIMINIKTKDTMLPIIMIMEIMNPNMMTMIIMETNMTAMIIMETNMMSIISMKTNAMTIVIMTRATLLRIWTTTNLENIDIMYFSNQV